MLSVGNVTMAHTDACTRKVIGLDDNARMVIHGLLAIRHLSETLKTTDGCYYQMEGDATRLFFTSEGAILC